MDVRSVRQKPAGFHALSTGERGRGFAIAALVIGCVYMVILAYITIGLFSSEGRTT